ncbi:DUF4870 family protein [Algiphilus sp.]|uniref:DUF4870 family protein n=1 Tax=Algiphilus sp. TaxID=1872431 RepID=UPI0025B8A35D|nr:hypothetical protein [Algiphilus sp.]MCK5771925.1 hypothetical protein [Algiphilus sp.]
MSEIIEESGKSDAAVPDEGTEGERNVVLVAYILHACAIFTGVTAIVGVIMNHLKVNDTESAFIRSHHRWMLRTFWWGLLWSIICGVLTFIFIGILGYFILAVWWIYRLVRGFLAYSERRPLPLPN